MSTGKIYTNALSFIKMECNKIRSNEFPKTYKGCNL